MKFLYFAWVRERIGKAEEERDVPADVETVADLKRWLAGIDEGYAYAFEEPGTIRVALDKRHQKDDAPIGGAREAAIFPPMTGG